MLSIARASWEQLDDFVSGCQTTLFICAPWISKIGLERLRGILLRKNPPLREVAIWSRLADADTDAAGILGVAKALAPSTNIELGDSPCLHAKVYVADRAVAMFGSANLTQAGFQDNLELLARTDDRQDVQNVLSFLESIRPSITSVSLGQLDHFVTQQLPLLPPEPLATAKPRLVPVWEQDSLLPVVAESKEAEPKQAAPPEAPDRLPQTAGVFVDPMQLVRDAREKLTSRQDNLQELDLDSMVGERLKLILYPVGDTFALGMMQGGMPFSEVVGTLIGRYEVIEASPRLQQLKDELDRFPFYRFRPLRKRTDVLVTAKYPTSDMIEKHFLLHESGKSYYIYNVEPGSTVSG